MNVRKVLSTIGSAAAALLIGQASAQELVIWHDLGDNGVKWFQAAGAEFAKTRPGVSVRSVSFPTEQWFGRAISSINTDTAPDLIYNNYERVIRVADQTNKLMDLRPVLASVSDKAFLSEDDLRVATHGNKMIILPVQRVQMALGVRKSWLDKVGEKFPATWADVQRVAVKFRDADPDGNGRADTFGMALQAAKPRDLIHMLDLFMFGSGLRHTVIDPQGKIVIDEPARAKVLEEVLKAYTEYRYMSPDTINHSFPEMYQIIEGGRAGMFRVGDWNVRKWDGPTVLKGDFLVGPWPAFDGRKNSVVIGGMRGVAVPENSPNKALAVEFAKFLLSKPAQQASLDNVGSGVRKDLDLAALSERQRYFATANYSLVAYDFPEAIHAFYPELEAAYHRKLLTALAKPPANWKAFISETANEMRALVTQLSAKK
jgi:ABC-type glycerol-3-phosphate transport system substrate-binding protein